MTYSKVGDEPPKVFQASAQTRMAPGGVRIASAFSELSAAGLRAGAVAAVWASAAAVFSYGALLAPHDGDSLHMSVC